MATWRFVMNRILQPLNWIALFLLLSVPHVMYSQTPSLYLLNRDSSYRQSSTLIELNAQGLWGSNGLDKSFLRKAIQGGHLTSDHIQSLYDAMNTQNRLGAIGSGGLTLYNFSDTLLNHQQWGMQAGFSTNYHGFVSFNRDLFKTLFIGNKSMAGEKTDLGPFVGGYQAWQKFGVGIFNKTTWSSVMISLVAGQHLESWVLNDLSLYTSALGDSLSLSYIGDYWRSDSLRKGFANGSGIGIALDFRYNLPLADDKGIISIALNDIGFVNWNKRTQQYRFDSTSTWTGIMVDQLFQFNRDSLSLNGLKDSLHYSRTLQKANTMLPLSVHVRYNGAFSAKHLYEAGLSIVPNRAAVPFIYAGLSQMFQSNFLVTERITYGGYGKWGVGIEAQWMPKNQWYFRIGTSNLEGFFLPKSFANSGYLTLAKFFGKPLEEQLPPID